MFVANLVVYLFLCRKTELYEMCWNIRDGLKDSLVATAPYGGPIGAFTPHVIVYFVIVYY